MTSPAYSDRPPTYHQVLASSQERLHQHHAPSPSQTPVIQTTTMKFSSQPVTMNCPYCGHIITTVVEEENGGLVYLLCILLVIFGFIFGCCLIPFCISGLKDKIHFCPRCQKIIGKMNIL